MRGRNPLDALPASAKSRLVERAPPMWVPPMLATLTDERQTATPEVPRSAGGQETRRRRAGGLSVEGRGDTLFEQYRRKRNFTETPEPVRRTGRRHIFVIQKHEAS